MRTLLVILMLLLMVPTFATADDIDEAVKRQLLLAKVKSIVEQTKLDIHSDIKKAWKESVDDIGRNKVTKRPKWKKVNNRWHVLKGGKYVAWGYDQPQLHQGYYWKKIPFYVWRDKKTKWKWHYYLPSIGDSGGKWVVFDKSTAPGKNQTTIYIGATQYRKVEESTYSMPMQTQQMYSMPSYSMSSYSMYSMPSYSSPMMMKNSTPVRRMPVRRLLFRGAGGGCAGGG